MGLLFLVLIATGAIGAVLVIPTNKSLKLSYLNKVITDLTINQLDLVSSIYADPDQITRAMEAIEVRLIGIEQAFAAYTATDASEEA